jgi:hypothetical protein
MALFYEYFRNDVFDAGNYALGGGGKLAKSELRKNRFGGSAGAPIVRDKLSSLETAKGFAGSRE